MAAVTRVIVPDVRGRTPEDAQAILSKAGLSPRNTARSAGPGAVGTVWQQTPTQGSTVIRGTSADITVVAAPSGTSDGDGEFRTRVPSLVGENVLQALRDINRSHLQAGSVTRQPGNGTTGAVTTQNPLAGQWVSVLSKVDITVNVPEKKPPSDKNSWKIVPPLSGQTQKAAAQILAETGLRLGQVTPGNAQSPSGTNVPSVIVDGSAVPRVVFPRSES
jgi:beta-lactam-binding protein with PASTA domain